MKVSNKQYDAWKVKPPCETEGQCHTGCPYFYECDPDPEDYPYYEEDSDEED